MPAAESAAAPAPAVAVAYSGGRDSTALLHATLAAARANGLAVVALHVHHGLSAHADAWLAHCERCCAQWAAEGAALSFANWRIDARPAAGESIEAWARQARYAALAAMALERGIDLVLLGHHRRDQAETVLLQALRAGGVSGLAAMPRTALRGGVTWARPWLGVDPGRIERYARRHGLDWVEDDSNADARLLRNRLRHAVWPALAEAFPHAEAALAMAAGHAAEAAACADELAAIDLAAVAATADGAGIGVALDLAAWARLSAARRGNLLRVWLKERTGVAAPASLLLRLREELAAGNAPASWPAPAGRVLRRYRGVLSCEARKAGVGTDIGTGTGTSTSASTDTHPDPGSSSVSGVRGAPNAADATGTADSKTSGTQQAATMSHVVVDAPAGAIAVPRWGGTLRWAPVASGGLALDPAGVRLWLAPRTGGETYQAAPGRPPRRLKKQFQAAGVAAWQRGAPLVHAGDALVYVPGLGHDARTWAPVGAPQVGFVWEADAALTDRSADGAFAESAPRSRPTGATPRRRV